MFEILPFNRVVIVPGAQTTPNFREKVCVNADHGTLCTSVTRKETFALLPVETEKV